MKKSKYKILLIDDDESILEAVKIVLEEEGYHVNTLNSLKGARKFIGKTKPNLIFLDLVVSELNGDLFINELKNDIKYKKIPVIILSAHALLPSLASKSRADDYLVKPFDIEELLLKVKSYLKE